MTRLVVIQHIEREGPGLFFKIAAERNIEIFTCRLYLGDKIPEVDIEDVLLIMGGPMGVGDINNDLYPWLNDEINLLKFALENNIRIIGVCLGAQLLAVAGGGSVEPLMSGVLNTRKAEVGWGKISFLDNNSQFSSLPNSTLDVLHWHGDRVIIPEASQLIATSPECKEQLFCINFYAYGIQFHAEVEDSMVSKWILEDKEFIDRALGPNASLIIKKQQEDYASKSLISRIDFINTIYDLLEINANAY